MSTLTILYKKRERLQDFRPNAMQGIKVYFKNGDFLLLRCKTKEEIEAETKKYLKDPKVKCVIPMERGI